MPEYGKCYKRKKKKKNQGAVAEVLGARECETERSFWRAEV